MVIIKFSKRKFFWGIGFILGAFLVLFGRLGGDNFLNHRKLFSFSKTIFISIVKADVPIGGGDSITSDGNIDPGDNASGTSCGNAGFSDSDDGMGASS